MDKRPRSGKVADKRRGSVLDDEFNRTVLHGVLKSLKWISIVTLDLKLAAIVALLEEYIAGQEKATRQKEKSQATPFGYERSSEDVPRTDPGMPEGYAR
jgi:hypothetical protein